MHFDANIASCSLAISAAGALPSPSRLRLSQLRWKPKHPWDKKYLTQDFSSCTCLRVMPPLLLSNVSKRILHCDAAVIIMPISVQSSNSTAGGRLPIGRKSRKILIRRWKTLRVQKIFSFNIFHAKLNRNFHNFWATDHDENLEDGSSGLMHLQYIYTHI